MRLKMQYGDKKPRGRLYLEAGSQKEESEQNWLGGGEPQDDLDNTDLGFEDVNKQEFGILTNSTSHGKSVGLGFGVGNSQGVAFLTTAVETKTKS